MENQNTQLPGTGLPHVDLPTPTINEHGQVTPQPQTPVPGGLIGKKSVREIAKSLIEKYKSSSKNVKLLVIVGIVFLFSILLLLIATLAKNGKSVEVAPTPSPTPTVTSGSPLPEIAISNPSRYASDSGILKIETDVDNLSKEMNSVDLRQSNLRVPTLDFNIKFQ